MKKILGISVLALLIAGIGAFMFFLNRGEVSIKDLPKDVPVISGKIVSTKAIWNDELKRGIEVEVETNLSLPEVVQYYSNEFVKRDIKVFGIPTFSGDSRELENSTEASGGGETKNHHQVMVYIRSEAPLTLVRISVF